MSGTACWPRGFRHNVRGSKRGLMSLPDPDFWRGRRVLVTGATGFKGAWLTLWLARMGAVVTSYAHPAPDGGIFAASGVAARVTPVTADIRHDAVLRECMQLMRP